LQRTCEYVRPVFDATRLDDRGHEKGLLTQRTIHIPMQIFCSSISAWAVEVSRAQQMLNLHVCCVEVCTFVMVLRVSLDVCANSVRPGGDGNVSQPCRLVG